MTEKNDLTKERKLRGIVSIEPRRKMEFRSNDSSGRIGGATVFQS